MCPVLGIVRPAAYVDADVVDVPSVQRTENLQ
jgi:hypothetical protein